MFAGGLFGVVFSAGKAALRRLLVLFPMAYVLSRLRRYPGCNSIVSGQLSAGAVLSSGSPFWGAVSGGLSGEPDALAAAGKKRKGAALVGQMVLGTTAGDAAALSGP